MPLPEAERKKRHAEAVARWRAANPEKVKAYTAVHEAKPETRAKRAAWEKRNREKRNARVRVYRANNLDKNADKQLRRYYGISLDQYNKMFSDQQGKCAICGKAEKLHVDHCHTTSKIRGLLCGRCNRGIGSFKDSITSLLNAARYLQPFVQESAE